MKKWNFPPFLSGFKKEVCSQCGELNDAVASSCKKCGQTFEINLTRQSFAHLTPLTPLKEMIIFLFGTLGLFLFSLLAQAVIISFASAVLWNGGLTGGALQEALSSYLESVDCLTLLNYGTYAIALIFLFLLLGRDFLNLYKTFKNKRVLYGFLMGAITFLLSYSLSLLLSLAADTSENQQLSNSMLAAYPALSFFMSIFLIPFFEECTYRLGLFTFLKRIHPLIAYLFSALIFGFVHLGNLSSLNEWLNFPVYALGGLLFAFTYDRFGFGASYLAHASYNLLAISVNLILIFAF